MKKCYYCKLELEDSAVTCPYCGHDVVVKKISTKNKNLAKTFAFLSLIISLPFLGLYAIFSLRIGVAGGPLTLIRDGLFFLLPCVLWFLYLKNGLKKSIFIHVIVFLLMLEYTSFTLSSILAHFEGARVTSLTVNLVCFLLYLIAFIQVVFIRKGKLFVLIALLMDLLFKCYMVLSSFISFFRTLTFASLFLGFLYVGLLFFYMSISSYVAKNPIASKSVTSK